MSDRPREELAAEVVDLLVRMGYIDDNFNNKHQMSSMIMREWSKTDCMVNRS